MTKLIRNNQKGFTLIELMIVVAIIGILAAIAIPNFMQYQLKAKTAEAKSNLGGIRTAQEAYKAENDVYILCGEYPPLRGAAGSTKVTWVDTAAATAGGWDDIGFSASGAVYYSYDVIAVGAIATGMMARATGNLDNVGTDDAVFSVTNAGVETKPAAGVF